MKAADGKTQTLETKNIVIATGSDVARLNGIDIDEKRVVSSTGALDFTKVPQKLLIVGAGIIGLELGSVWRRLGAEVMIVEFLDHILPGIDSEVARQFHRMLQKQGIAFKLASKVTGDRHLRQSAQGEGRARSRRRRRRRSKPTSCWSRSGACRTPTASVSKRSASSGTIAAALSSTRICARMSPASTPSATSSPARCWRTRPRMKASPPPKMIAGQAGHVNYEVIPNVVYTYPEIASVGKTEEELKQAGVAYQVGKFPFTANGRARANCSRPTAS